MKWPTGRYWIAMVCFLASSLTGAEAATPTEATHTWQHVIRNSPYWISQGAYENLATIRRWVLTGSSFCENSERHIFFDERATFLGYVSNGEDAPQTQAKLNEYRAQLAANGRVKSWAPGKRGFIGYPFALSCNQPEALLSTAVERYTGRDQSARLWGTWDGMRIGTENEMVSLHKAINLVYKNRRSAGRISMEEDVLSTLAGKVLIESGGRARAHSAADARGVMQLSKTALRDCGLAARHHFHRMAQIDCALRLLEQNHRNLKETFNTTYGHLPKKKQNELYAMLLLQAYHGGAARVGKLMTDPEMNGAANYFAQHHQRFSAGDIALGMVFHNLGRDRWGFASLYYVTDVGIARDVACRAVTDMPGC